MGFDDVKKKVTLFFVEIKAQNYIMMFRNYKMLYRDLVWKSKKISNQNGFNSYLF
jgi:hypothetical protein